MASTAVVIDISCAVEVFLAAALLQKEQPERDDFTIQEIVNRAARENITGEIRSGINVHASQHCVANKTPNPAKHRMLFATGKHTRRLLLPGDAVHPERTGKIFPEAGELPEEFLPLLEWVKDRYEKARVGAGMTSGKIDERDRSMGNCSDSVAEVQKVSPRYLEELLRARGIGAEMAAGIDPDDYLRELREGWE